MMEVQMALEEEKKKMRETKMDTEIAKMKTKNVTRELMEFQRLLEELKKEIQKEKMEMKTAKNK